MSRRYRRTRAATLVALACLLTTAAAADAAEVTLRPSAPEARTFAASAAGWTSSTGYGGVCVVGLTCPVGSGAHVSAGGTGGTGDGHLRASFSTTLLSLLSATTVTWTSPTFTVPAGLDEATLSLAVRPGVANLLAVLSGVQMDVRVLDVADPSRSVTVTELPIRAASSSFTTLRLAVPAAALQPGRDYAVRIDVTVAATVTAVSSGTVDIDDVELRLTDLRPPSDLSAVFPGTGAPRIEGAVDPQGQATVVTVEYGPTTAYGSTTAPIAIAGTGAQPFTVPLAGLTPGATYQYRVLAQNADGTIGTANASFVAPTPPDDAPPVVTGAGNERARTAIFDRAADVVAATVEVLDDASRVVGTFPVAAGDSAAIVLPDADGAYLVRVVRENAAAQRTVSATVPVSLDRVAPDVTGVGLAVRPVLSNDPRRTVTYDAPADAVAVSVQVQDGDGAATGPPAPTSGGAATVELGPGDGTYRVELTFLDGAGNAATVLGDPVVLDTVAPDPGDAPRVGGPGNDRVREVAFQRASDAATAAIEILDDLGTVIDAIPLPAGADTAAIVLPDADGPYGVRVRQTDAAGNDAVSPATATVLDRVAPDAGPAPTVTGPPDALEVAFERAPDAETAVVEVVDGDGRVLVAVTVPSGGATTLALPAAPGDYTVRVVQTDAAGNAATTPGTVATRPAAGDDGDDRRTGDDDRSGTGDGPGPDDGDRRTGDGPGPDDGDRRTGDGAGPGDDVDSGGSGHGGPGRDGTGGDRAGGPGTGTPGNAHDGGGTPGHRDQGAGALTDPGRFGAMLQRCFGGDVVLLDATVRGTRVRVQGLTRYAPGTTVRIVDLRGRTVGRARSDAAGRFRAAVRAPRARRQRLRAGYRAVVGRQRSPVVRLRRANTLDRVALARGVVTVRGRVDLRRAGRVRRIVALGGRGAGGCASARPLRALGRPRINARSGAYTLRVRAPQGTGRVVVRTKVTGSKLTSRSSFAMR